MSRLTLSFLGGSQARPDVGPPLYLPVKAQVLLAYLAARPLEPQPRDKFATLLWGDTGEERQEDRLRERPSHRSRDGNRLAFTVPFAAACDADTLCLDSIYVVNADGTELRRLGYRVNAALQGRHRGARRRDKISLDEILPSFHEDGRYADPIVDWSTGLDDPACGPSFGAF